MATHSAHHVGLTVTDLDRAVAFYTDTFDLEVVAEFEVAGDAFATAVDVDGASGSFAHLDADGIRLELVEYDPSGAVHEESALNQPGTAHVGFSVDDVDAFYESLDSSIDTLSDPQTSSSGTRLCFLRDPDGNLIEVLDV